jgi:hypothetical protein
MKKAAHEVEARERPTTWSKQMALSRIQIPPDAKRDARARELLKTIHLWHTVTLRQPWGSFPRGAQALQTPNGYRVNAVYCECPDYEQNQRICKHIRAVVMQDEAKQTPKPAPAYADLFPTCRVVACDGDPEPHEQFCWRHVTVDAF